MFNCGIELRTTFLVPKFSDVKFPSTAYLVFQVPQSQRLPKVFSLVKVQDVVSLTTFSIGTLSENATMSAATFTPRKRELLSTSNR